MMYISAVVKAHGCDCHILIDTLEKDIITEIWKQQPDLIGFQVFTGQHQWALQCAREIKRFTDTPILFGGSHPTHNPDIADKIDYICRGEGEYATLDLLRNPDDKGIPNINRNPLRPLADIDSLPFPDRTLYDRYPIFSDDSIRRFITSRGCPYQCTFCHNHLDMELYRGLGKWARKRHPQSVIDEIKEVYLNHPFKIVDFSPDDYFLSEKKWSVEFLELYAKQIRLPFCFNTRPESIDKDIAILLKRANCRAGAISIESADDYLRNSVLKKQTKIDDIMEAVYCMKQQGIIVKTYNMIGIPGETIEQALKTLRLNMRLKPTWARCAIISPYPNTNIWNTGLERGVLEPMNIDKFSDNYTDETLFNIKNKNKFVNLQRFFAIGARFPILYPLVRITINMPRNKIFDFVGRLFFGFYAVRYWGYSLKDIYKYSRYYLKTGQPI
jgi:anaerobic magnesium-protoporphyrin IX monomethyl ester cyclase